MAFSGVAHGVCNLLDGWVGDDDARLLKAVKELMKVDAWLGRS
jgi:hypothetical protein